MDGERPVSTAPLARQAASASWPLITRPLAPAATWMVSFSLTASHGYKIGAVVCVHAKVCPKATAKVTKVSCFRDWLLAEAAEDALRLQTSGFTLSSRLAIPRGR
jgi:hypothetical protein